MRRRDFITAMAGSAAGWPLAASAQQEQANVKRIALVHPVLVENGSPYFAGLLSQLQRLGYFEGKNLIVDRRSGEGRTDRYAEIARELVGLKPDVLAVTGARILPYFREATTTIPIVALTGDPILLESLRAFLDLRVTSPPSVLMQALKFTANIWKF